MKLLLAALALAAASTPVSLFDGHSLNGWWWSPDAAAPAPSWAAGAGILRTTPGQGTEVYLLTRDSFSDFDLSFEFNFEPGANSGVKYRFQGYWVGPPGTGKVEAEPGPPTRIEPIALEYQIADDVAHPDAAGDSRHATAAIYEYWPAAKSGPCRPNMWHTGRIVARGMHIEHWLDGVKVVDVELDSAELQAAFRASERRRSSPLLAKQARRTSPIALQFHDKVVQFRNLSIRRL